MTAKSDFTEEEWGLVAEGPAIAGMIAATAQKGGTFRESYALAKTYAEARQHHGESELLDTLVSEKPHFDRHKYHSAEELQGQGLQRIHEATSLLESKATPDDVTAYKTFTLNVAKNVAAAHKEDGEKVSPAEEAAIAAVSASLEGGGPA
ncbi:MAG TPA: hypothetical protein VLU96_07970 [Gaiellaceae bacterium]|nr:hypothetical protein [Gaiellaceae bacterium]